MSEYVYSGLPKKLLDTKMAFTLWQEGMSDAEIGRNCGVTTNTVANWRRKNGLTAHKKYPKRKKTGLEWLHRFAEINAQARANGMTYGKYTAPAVIVRGRRK